MYGSTTSGNASSVKDGGNIIWSSRSIDSNIIEECPEGKGSPKKRSTNPPPGYFHLFIRQSKIKFLRRYGELCFADYEDFGVAERLRDRGLPGIVLEKQRDCKTVLIIPIPWNEQIHGPLDPSKHLHFEFDFERVFYITSRMERVLGQRIKRKMTKLEKNDDPSLQLYENNQPKTVFFPKNHRKLNQKMERNNFTVEVLSPKSPKMVDMNEYDNITYIQVLFTMSNLKNGRRKRGINRFSLRIYDKNSRMYLSEAGYLFKADNSKEKPCQKKNPVEYGGAHWLELKSDLSTPSLNHHHHQQQQSHLFINSPPPHFLLLNDQQQQQQQPKKDTYLIPPPPTSTTTTTTISNNKQEQQEQDPEEDIIIITGKKRKPEISVMDLERETFNIDNSYDYQFRNPVKSFRNNNGVKMNVESREEHKIEDPRNFDVLYHPNDEFHQHQQRKEEEEQQQQQQEEDIASILDGLISSGDVFEDELPRFEGIFGDYNCGNDEDDSYEKDYVSFNNKDIMFEEEDQQQQEEDSDDDGTGFNLSVFDRMICQYHGDDVYTIDNQKEEEEEDLFSVNYELML